MDFETRFTAIKDFLSEHQYLHELEPLERYPFADTPYLNWAHNLESLSPNELILLENNLDSSLIQNEEYRNYLDTIKQLTQLPTLNIKTSEVPQNLKRKLSEKKQHEVRTIRAQLDQYPIQNFVDIGSGAGHLSSFLLYNNDKHSTCIDLNADFQKIGINKLKREAPQVLARMDFQNQEFTKATPLKESENCALLGLHACGDLSVSLIKTYADSKLDFFLNYPCCFHKLSESEINISHMAQMNSPLKLTNHALTMAAKSFKKLTLKEVQERQAVKNFRYCIHLFMQENLNGNFKTLGNALAQDYLGDFGIYAHKYLAESKDYTLDELNDFYQQKLPQVKQIQHVGIIRSHLSRLIEIYLNLDRALYLKEKGLKVEIMETFDPSISPRNICLFSKR